MDERLEKLKEDKEKPVIWVNSATCSFAPLSHDAIHFHEPIPGFRLIPAREQPESPLGVVPALSGPQAAELDQLILEIPLRAQCASHYAHDMQGVVPLSKKNPTLLFEAGGHGGRG